MPRNTRASSQYFSNKLELEEKTKVTPTLLPGFAAVSSYYKASPATKVLPAEQMEMATDAATSILSADEVFDHTPEKYAETNNAEAVSHDMELVSSTLHYVKNVTPVKEPDHESGIVPLVLPDSP